MTDREIGKRVRVLRERADITQADMARELGIGGAALSILERGESRLTVTRMLDICKVLGITVPEFFADAQPLPGDIREEVMGHVGAVLGPTLTLVEELNKLAGQGSAVLKAARSVKLAADRVGGVE